MWVDWVISLSIIFGMILTIWARVSNQTVGELLRDLKEFAQDSGEDTVEGMVYYE